MRMLARTRAIFAAFAAVIVILSLGPVTAAAEKSAQPYAPSKMQVSQYAQFTMPYSGMLIDCKNTVFQNGDSVSLYRFHSAAETGSIEPFSIQIGGRNGTVTYYDEVLGEWKSIPLEGTLPDAVSFIDTDTASVILGPAVVYKSHGDGNLQDIGTHGTVAVDESAIGYTLKVHMSLERQTEGHLWVLNSSDPAVEWNDDTRAIWQRLNFNGLHRICFDGPYYVSPSSYTPYAPGMYCRIPALHPVSVLLPESWDTAEELSIVMLNEALTRQNEDGYWTTPAEALWLKTDYGIGSGFYDTRFNNDVTMQYFNAYRKFGNREYLDAALRQSSWLLRYAEENKFPSGEGILVGDYSDPSRPFKLTHCSLNHLLQEIKVLLTAHDMTGDERYSEMAERMIAGIRGSEEKWISREKGLLYAVLPDGTAGFQDYPYLTYNDLYMVQEMLEERGGRDPSLDRLMVSKLRHMLTNGIEGYNAYPLKEMPIPLRQVFNEFRRIEAKPGSNKVFVNGVQMYFDAYEISSENYFKLRDVAAALNGTERQFEITWDEAGIYLTSGKGYTALGNELLGGSGIAASALLSTQTVSLDGRTFAAAAYMIGGSNYFRLRDLGEELGFTVRWDPTTASVLIDTTLDK